MRKRYAGMVPVGIMVLFFCACLGGCSLSLCGVTVGEKEELAFLCKEEVEERLPEEPGTGRTAGASPAADAGREGAPPVEEAEESGEEPEASADGKVNLNTAGVEELMTLKGVGESRAKAIIEYRTQQGAFTRIEDIMQIPGIKEGIFSKIQDKIAVH